MLILGGGGGVATQKNRTLPQISNLGLVFFFCFLGYNPPPPIRGPGYVIVHDREGKALTMTTTPWNLPHGHFDHGHEFTSAVKFQVDHFDHEKFEY